MPATVVIGTQWGDEGKGKIVDILAADVDIVVRFHGGNNAGHTVVVKGEKTILNLIPAGVLHPGRICMMGPGLVIDPEVLTGEINTLRARGYLASDAWLRISEQAHLIMPYHRAIDRARERLRGAGKIGTTGRGIGPAYEDKMARTGIRVGDLFDETGFREALGRSVREKNGYLQAILGEAPLSFDDIYASYTGYRDLLRPFVSDTGAELRAALATGGRVLLEGAHGTMLDVDHGTYPFVTSSSVVAGAAAAGAGLPPHAIGRVIGIAKAYTTRVGGGPFPTELTDALGERLRADGDEYGSTTGRPRRCGWFDAVVVRQAVVLSGVDSLALTKLDVLTGIDPLRVCVAYELGGRRLVSPPTTGTAWERLTPVYEDLPGWRESLSGARALGDLPVNARRYVERLVALVGARVALLSIGAQREQTIRLD
ncbi:MAG TPA: adenylosuccinate synthase [Candidatus Binatus sp.]|nr:adenylosuccinate synthase [Candidatus Binatus sp.]